MDQDDDPYGLTVKPGPPWEHPPKTPAVSVPPNVQVDTVDEILIETVKVSNISAHEDTGKTVHVNIEPGQLQSGQGHQDGVRSVGMEATKTDTVSQHEGKDSKQRDL